MLPARQLLALAPRYTAVRTLASAAQASDPIQKLFVDKIREYTNKSKSAANGLVGSDDKIQKQLAAEMERVANLYGVKDVKNIANLGLKFDDTAKLESINMRK